MLLRYLLPNIDTAKNHALPPVPPPPPSSAGQLPVLPPHPQACSYQPALARVSCQCSQPGTATSLSIKWKMFQPELCCSNADHLVIFTPSPGCSYSAPVLPGADPVSGSVRSQPSQPHSAGQGLWTVEDWKYQVRSGY